MTAQEGSKQSIYNRNILCHEYTDLAGFNVIQEMWVFVSAFCHSVLTAAAIKDYKTWSQKRFWFEILSPRKKDYAFILIWFCCYFFFFSLPEFTWISCQTQLDKCLHDQAVVSFMKLMYLVKAICVLVCLHYREYFLNTDVLVFCDSRWIWIWEVRKWWSLLEVLKKKNPRPSSKAFLCMHWHIALSSALRIDNNVNFVIPAQANSVEVNSFTAPFKCLMWFTYNFSLRLIYLTRNRTRTTLMIGRFGNRI